MSEDRKLTRREEVTRMREERLRQKEVNLTFRPALKKSPSTQSLDESSVGSRFDKLYDEAKKRKEAGKKDVNQYSFKPTITSKGQKRSSTPEGTSKRLYDAPGAGKPRRSTSVDKAKDRSFSPQITSRGKRIERQGSLSSPATRLYSQAQSQKENREALVSKISKEAEKECTFAPKTNSDTKSPNSGVSIADRMEKYMAVREKRLQDLKDKKQAQEAQDATFKPTSFTKGRPPTSRPAGHISKERKTVPSPAKDESATPTVFDRLANATPQKGKKQVVYVDKDEKELTFKPNLVTKRAASPLRQEEASKYGNIHNRLYQKGHEQRLENDNKKAELRKEMEKEHTFAPSVPSNHRSNADSPTKGAVFERLSASRQYVHEILSQVKTEFELDNCTFTPEINKVSDDIGSKKHTEPAYLRLSAEANRLREENAKRQAKKQEEELVDCTFAPSIDKKSTKVVSSRRGSAKESVFERLSVSGSAPTSPQVEENHPVNVPKVLRKSTLEKLVNSKGVIGEAGSPKKEKEQSVNDDDSHQQTSNNEKQREENIVQKLAPISPVVVPTKQSLSPTEDFFNEEESEF